MKAHPLGMTCGDCWWFDHCRACHGRSGKEHSCHEKGEERFLQAWYHGLKDEQGNPVRRRTDGASFAGMRDIRPRLNLSAITGRPKRQVWDVIQRERPDLARSLAEVGKSFGRFEPVVTVLEEDLPDEVFTILGRQRRAPVETYSEQGSSQQ